MSDATHATAVERNALVRAWELGKKIDPRYLIAFLITLVLVAAQLRYHMFGGYERLALSLAVCLATEAVLSWFDRGKVVNLLSAYISGISLTLLIKPQGGALWPFALGGFLAISSKYVLRYRDNHLWNPTNFAICRAAARGAGSHLRAQPPVRQRRHDQPGDLDLRTDHRRARRRPPHHAHVRRELPAVEHACAPLALGQPVLPEIAPITGPMYQLFIFFMITDPRTVVRGRQPADRGGDADRGDGDADPVRVRPGMAAADGVQRGAGVLRAGDGGPVAKWLDLKRASSETTTTRLITESDGRIGSHGKTQCFVNNVTVKVR